MRQAVVAVVMVVVMTMVASGTWTPPTYNATVWDAFRSKVQLDPFADPTVDPYTLPDFNTTWVDHVCAVHYPYEPERGNYTLKTYPTAAAATAAGDFVTHLHPCGLCSTTQDLSIYMQDKDLTNPVRECGMLTVVSQEMALRCLMDIGFTKPCSLIWMYDAIHTRKVCFKTCIKDWFEGIPNNTPPNSTTLNPCLQCDEDKSGPIFKVVAGRTRRDSGLLSSINRPLSSIYHVVHDYF